MTSKTVENSIKQLQSLVDTFNSLCKESVCNDLSGIDDLKIAAFLSRARASIMRVGGRDSQYMQEMKRKLIQSTSVSKKAIYLAGIVCGLKTDVENGYLESFEENAHGEVLADTLDTAQHFLDEGHPGAKDAAAVLAGGTLESHLRLLCEKYDVDTTFDAKDGPRPKKADAMNADLCKAGAYEMVDQKIVTAWLHIRNDAAHANYDKYDASQVGQMIFGIRNFIIRNPA